MQELKDVDATASAEICFCALSHTQRPMCGVTQ